MSAEKSRSPERGAVGRTDQPRTSSLETKKHSDQGRTFGAETKEQSDELSRVEAVTKRYNSINIDLIKRELSSGEGLARTVRIELKDHPEGRELESITTAVEVSCEFVRVQVDVINTGAPKDKLHATVAATASLQAAVNRVEALQARVDSDKIRRLLKTLRGAADDLWPIIATIMTPQEWTLKVEANVLFAKAGVEIKFGK